MNAYTAHECAYGPDRNARKPGAEQPASPRGLVLRENGGSGEGGKQEPAPAGASRGGRPGPLARLGRDTRAAIGIPGVLVAAMLVGATALPVANITLNADSKRMEDAATAAGLAATGKMRAEGVGVSAEVLRREAERYARLNLLDLPPADRRKALESLQIRMTRDLVNQIVRVDLEATLPGRKIVQALMVAPGAGKVALSEKTTGKSQVQCVSDKVELVLALDMTDSMGGPLAQAGMPWHESPPRYDVMLDVVAEMVGSIQRLCSDLELKVGIVPWASSVKVPDGQANRWKSNGWIDARRFALRGADQSVEAQQWGGCLEDRLMNTSSLPESSLGLSLDTAEDRYFPPYIYPDTERHTKRTEWGQAMQRFIRAQAARGLTGLPDDDPATLLQVLRGDNDWSRGGGPNKGCTPIGMIPPRTLTSTDTWFTEALALRDVPKSSLPGEGTMAHLGVTWGRRMLHPAWGAIWDPDGSPDDAKGGSHLEKDKSVKQVLVLLSDGGNGIKRIDPWTTTPGRARVVLGLNAIQQMQFGLPGSLAGGEEFASKDLETAAVTGYSALGRNGPGALADGHRGDTDHVTGTDAGIQTDVPDVTRKGRDFLDKLLKASCSEARKEEIDVYTVSLSAGMELEPQQLAPGHGAAGMCGHQGRPGRGGLRLPGEERGPDQGRVPGHRPARRAHPAGRVSGGRRMDRVGRSTGTQAGGRCRRATGCRPLGHRRPWERRAGGPLAVGQASVHDFRVVWRLGAGLALLPIRSMKHGADLSPQEPGPAPVKTGERADGPRRDRESEARVSNRERSCSHYLTGTWDGKGNSPVPSGKINPPHSEAER